MYISVDLTNGIAVCEVLENTQTINIDYPNKGKSLSIDLTLICDEISAHLKSAHIATSLLYSQLFVIVCCGDEVIADEDYIKQVVANLLKIQRKNVYITGIRAAGYDYFLSHRYPVNTGDIFAIVKKKMSQGEPHYRVALFTPRMYRDKIYSVVYYKYAMSTLSLEELVTFLKEEKRLYEKHEFKIILVVDDDNVDLDPLERRKLNILDSKFQIVKQNTKNVVLGALMKLKFFGGGNPTFVKTEEFMDDTVKPVPPGSCNSFNVDVNPLNLPVYCGIDLGTTKCSITVLTRSSNTPHSYWIESSVTRALDGKFEIGGQFFDQNNVFDIKRMIGKSLKQVKNMNNDNCPWPFDIVEHGKRVKIKMKNVELLPEQVLAELIKHLIQGVFEKYRIKVDSAVFTVPLTFNDPEITSIKFAALLVGIDVLEVISEPIAAYYGYRSAGFKPEETTLVLDLGGHSFDCVVILSDHDDNRQETPYKENVGGRDFDNVVFNMIARELEDKLDLTDERVRVDVMAESERVKKLLSTETEVWSKYAVNITRIAFEAEAEPLFQIMNNIITKALTSKQKTEKEIGVILYGGRGCAMPRFKQIISDRFSHYKNTILEPEKTDSELMQKISFGAAFYGRQKYRFVHESEKLERKIQKFLKVELKAAKRELKSTLEVLEQFGDSSFTEDRRQEAPDYLQKKERERRDHEEWSAI